MNNIAPLSNLTSTLIPTSQTKLSSDALKEAARTKDMAKIDQAAKDFEAVFVTELLKPMFEGIKTNENFGGGKGEEIFRGFMIQEYGKMMAETGRLGIADQIKADMIRMQEDADKAANNNSAPDTYAGTALYGNNKAPIANAVDVNAITKGVNHETVI